MSLPLRSCSFFFFNDTATTEIYTLSLHDALPISELESRERSALVARASFVHPHMHRNSGACVGGRNSPSQPDRKSTRLNSSHGYISYAVFCLKKKKNKKVDVRSECPRGPRR